MDLNIQNIQIANKVQIIDYLNMSINMMNTFDKDNHLNVGKISMCEELLKMLKNGKFDFEIKL